EAAVDLLKAAGGRGGLSRPGRPLLDRIRRRGRPARLLTGRGSKPRRSQEHERRQGRDRNDAGHLAPVRCHVSPSAGTFLQRTDQRFFGENSIYFMALKKERTG